MGKKHFNNDKNMFFNTLTDMRKLIQKNTNSYTSSTLGVSKKKEKMPYNHLVGRRKVIKEKYKEEKSRAREEGIQYDSNMRLMNSSVMKQFERKGKDAFDKNKYKYDSQAISKIGREN